MPSAPTPRSHAERELQAAREIALRYSRGWCSMCDEEGAPLRDENGRWYHPEPGVPVELAPRELCDASNHYRIAYEVATAIEDSEIRRFADAALAAMQPRAASSEAEAVWRRLTPYITECVHGPEDSVRSDECVKCQALRQARAIALSPRPAVGEATEADEPSRQQFNDVYALVPAKIWRDAVTKLGPNLYDDLLYEVIKATRDVLRPAPAGAETAEDGDPPCFNCGFPESEHNVLPHPQNGCKSFARASTPEGHANG